MASASASTVPSAGDIVYGELIVLGYNGHYDLTKGKQQKRCSTKFILKRKPSPSGVKKGGYHEVSTPKQSKAVLDTKQHSISYTLSRNRAIVVEYAPDTETDMFQIGRSTEPQIDFTVVDTWLGLSNANGTAANGANGIDMTKPVMTPQSTISRYACRILVDRGQPHRAKLYAAGFDTSRNIFLGEKACKWSEAKSIDGLTTNGILILHPKWSQTSEALDAFVWREVSVGGDIYTLRPARSSTDRGKIVDDETNILDDGTLIDLCGATLLFRTTDGLLNSPTEEQLEERLNELNQGKPQCPVNLNTLIIPKRKTLKILEEESLPYVYLTCGHVQGKHAWGHKDASGHDCPLCYVKSPSVIQLSMGMEPSFHLDSGQLDYCFNPCGHMASHTTVKYWARIPLPQGTSSFRPVCPFCTTTLDAAKPFVRLIFQDHCSSP